MTQKFFKGDLVLVGEMPWHMAHFIGNCKAIVLSSYDELYSSGKGSPCYRLYILRTPNGGEHSWYQEDQLTLLAPNSLDLLPPGHIDRVNYEAKIKRDLSLNG